MQKISNDDLIDTRTSGPLSVVTQSQEMHKLTKEIKPMQPLGLRSSL